MASLRAPDSTSEFLPVASMDRSFVRAHPQLLGRFPFFSPILSFATWEEQSEEAAWDVEAWGCRKTFPHAPKRQGDSEAGVDLLSENLGMSPGSAPALLCGLG